MIDPASLTSIGKVNKTHGINGELSVVFFGDYDYDLLNHIFFCMDGIYVPFFIENIRSRGTESALITIDDVNSDEAASEFVGKEFFAERDNPTLHAYDDFDPDGFYAEDLIGWEAHLTDGSIIGKITDVDSSTSNVLFIIRTCHGGTAYVPVTPDFIDDIDRQNRIITFELPEGLLNLN